MDDILDIEIRSVWPEDMAYVYDTYKRHNYNADYQDERYLQGRAKQLERYLERGAEIKVACNRECPEQIIGYALAELPILHYIHVKQLFWGQGVARQLLAAIGLGGASHIFCSNWNKAAGKINETHNNILWRI